MRRMRRMKLVRKGEEDEEMLKARMRTRWRHSGANGSRRKAAGGRTRI